MAAGVRARRASRCRRRRGRACPTTRRWPASAPTGPTLRFGLEIDDLGDAAARAASSRSSRACSAAAASSARSTPARASCRARSSTASTTSSSVHGAEGLSGPFVAGGRRLALADSPSSSRAEQIAAVNAELEAAERRPAAVRRRHARRPRAASLGELRLHLAERFGLIPEGAPRPAVDRRLPDVRVRRGRRSRRWDALHHPFTAPAGDLDDPGALRSRAYDLVWTASEIGGGSIRIHTPEVQQAVFEHLGIDAEEAARALRLPARGAALRRAAARRHRHRHRPHRRARLRPGLDPRRDRLPEDRHRRRPADRRARAGRRAAAQGAGAAARWSSPAARPA